MEFYKFFCAIVDIYFFSIDSNGKISLCILKSSLKNNVINENCNLIIWLYCIHDSLNHSDSEGLVLLYSLKIKSPVIFYYVQLPLIFRI